MIKVICINANPINYSKKPLLIEGNTYHVVGFNPYDNGYILAEVKSKLNIHGSYLKERFIEIGNIDETELAEQRELQTI